MKRTNIVCNINSIDIHSIVNENVYFVIDGCDNINDKSFNKIVNAAVNEIASSIKISSLSLKAKIRKMLLLLKEVNYSDNHVYHDTVDQVTDNIVNEINSAATGESDTLTLEQTVKNKMKGKYDKLSDKDKKIIHEMSVCKSMGGPVGSSPLIDER